MTIPPKPRGYLDELLRQWDIQSGIQSGAIGYRSGFLFWSHSLRRTGFHFAG